MTMPGKLSEDRRSRLVLALVLAGVLLAYLSTIVIAYAKSDDFNFLADAKNGSMRFDQNPFTPGGRPVLALFMVEAFSLCRSLSDLAFLRGFALLCTLLFVGMIYRWARRTGWSMASAAAVAALSVLNIGWAVYVGWTACFPYPLASALAFQAGVLAWEAWQAPGIVRRVALLVAAALCLLVVFCIYQPSVGFVFLPAVLAMLGDRRPHLPSLATPFALYAGSSVIYFIGYTVAKSVFRWSGEAVARGQLGFDPMIKISYFAKEILVPLFQGWGGLIPGPASWLYFAFTVALLGVFLIRPQAGQSRWLALAVGMLAAGFTLIPVLMPAAPYAPFRTLAPACAILAAFCVAALRGLPRVPEAAVFGALIVLGLLHCGFWTWNGMVAQRAAEWRILREKIAREFPALPSFLVFRAPEVSNPNPYTVSASRHEYGAIDSCTPWVPEALVNVVAADLILARGRVPAPRDWKRIGVAMVRSSTPCETEGYPMIDANAALQGQPRTQWKLPAPFPGNADQQIGVYTKLLNWNWCFSPALGYFRSWDVTNRQPLRMLDHPRFGRLRFASRGGNGLVFRGDAGEGVTFSETLYPEAVVRDSATRKRERVSLKGPFALP